MQRLSKRQRRIARRQEAEAVKVQIDQIELGLASAKAKQLNAEDIELKREQEAAK